jgi:hypothetical protein
MRWKIWAELRSFITTAKPKPSLNQLLNSLPQALTGGNCHISKPEMTASISKTALPSRSKPERRKHLLDLHHITETYIRGG